MAKNPRFLPILRGPRVNEAADVLGGDAGRDGPGCEGGFETVERVQLPGDLERIRQFSVISLLNLLRLHLQGLRP